jgi:hypothetical protein
MDAKPLLLALFLAPAGAFANGCATDPSYGAGCGGGYPQASTATPQIDYNYGYGTRTDVYLRGDGQIQVYEHMSSGPDDEVRVYDWQDEEDWGDE